ncbi:MAG TPA: hypothetical protein VFP10_12475 [Candidatus Eisenbacteria bacterium]|nr:hypothetical protein [Candidatus Eisenbacteria bacterium]
MNVIVMLEAHPDWIMLTNAITIKIRHGCSAIYMLGNLALDLSALRNDDTLFLIGHANEHVAGDYNVRQLAETLRARRLPEGHQFISLPSSCEVAKDTPSGSFIQRLVVEMSLLGYHRVSATGAVGLSISGWDVDQVVTPALTDPYLDRENASISDNNTYIDRAKVIAATVGIHTPPDQIEVAAKAIAGLVEYFYENLARRSSPYLMPHGTGRVTEAMATFRLTVQENLHGEGLSNVRTSLNRSPQPIVIELRSHRPVGVPAVHWAWESARVLRVEAPTSLRALVAEAGANGRGARIAFSNPTFNLTADSIA